MIIMSCQDSAKKEGAEDLDRSQKKVVIAYLAGWSDIKAEKIPTDQLTHINYAFGTVIDGKVTENIGQEKRDSINYAELHKAKVNSDGRLKLIGSIGGWFGCKGFHDAVKTSDGLALFTKTSVEYIQRYDLDGIDYDWEYPALPGADNPYGPEDKDNFILMLKSVRDTLDKMEAMTGRHYITSIASGGFDEFISVNDMGKAAEYLDFVNIMTYDFHSGLDSVSGHHTSLYSTYPDELSADRSVKMHIKAGVPVQKLVMGIAFYGRSWKGVQLNNKGLYQQARTGGQGFRNKRLDSLSTLKNSGFEMFWDSIASAPYLFHQKDSVFVSYEDERSIQAKCDYVNQEKMLGVMFWELSEDTENYKLLDVITENLE